MRSVRAALAVVCLLATGGVASANLLTNGSFESGVASVGAFVKVNAVNSTAITGWTVSSGSVDIIGTFWTHADGSRSLDMNGGGPGAIQQTVATTSGTTYRLRFHLAGNPGGTTTLRTLGVAATGTNLNTSQNFNFDTTGYDTTNMGWTRQDWFFTAQDASTTISFSGVNSGAFGPALDNVILAAVPEPASLVLVGAGALVLAGYGIRRRRRTARVTS